MKSKLNFTQSIVAGTKAAGVSAVINAILFFAFHAAGVITDTVFIQPEQPLTVVPVLISSVLPTLIGACLFFLFERFTNAGYTIFTVIAIAFLLFSFSSPFMAVPGMPIPYGIALNVMHVVVAFSLLIFLRRAKK